MPELRVDRILADNIPSTLCHTARHWYLLSAKQPKGLGNQSCERLWTSDWCESQWGGCRWEVGVLGKVLMLSCMEHSEGPVPVCSWSFFLFWLSFMLQSLHNIMSTRYIQGSNVHCGLQAKTTNHNYFEWSPQVWTKLFSLLTCHWGGGWASAECQSQQV